MSVPQFRTCPVTGDVVILAPERALRPMPIVVAAAAQVDCPLCPGMEFDTPRESYAIREVGTVPDGPGWRLRVVPNKFPFVRQLRAGEVAPPGAGIGVHELVIETERHCDPGGLTVDEMARVLLAYRDRLLTLGGRDWCRSVIAFRNVGAEAGASLAHPHSQVVALPIVPPGTRREWDGATRFHTATGKCGFCEELADPTRFVARGETYAAICPFAPRFAYETWLMPIRHAGRFESIRDCDAPELAGALLELFARLRRVIPGVAFNLTLHSAPPRGPVPAGWHWQFKLLPRTAKLAGFEWAAGCFVNPVPPEVAAARLREAGQIGGGSV